MVDIPFQMPSREDIVGSALRRWEVSGRFNIDQWPDELHALSMPTKFLAVDDIERFMGIYDGDDKIMGEYAGKLDRVIGWDQHFIRLNSRSPKDASYPVAPITCAGKQAMFWIASSMRCMEDAALHEAANKPFFICAREWRPIRAENEFRCFAKDGKLIAVSRYDYLNPSVIPNDFSDQLWVAAKRFYEAHLAHHYNDVVFDLHAPGSDQQLLIELNPYGLSDPCLFQSYAEVEKGGVRVGDLPKEPQS